MQFSKVIDVAFAVAYRLQARLYLRPSCECLICGARLRRFVPYRRGLASLSAFVKAVGIVGSDVENFGCPRCGSHDRERHLVLYLRATGLLAEMVGARILHFAPERHLSRVIADAGPSEYLKGDIRPGAPDVIKIDMRNIQFDDCSFDWIIANHVMEHVDDDFRALLEIRRVLRPGGRVILQTPYAPMLHKTFEDAGIHTESSRLQAYGQEDHVRLYGRDVFDRFASVGLKPRGSSHSELLPDTDARYLGVNPLEPFFLFERPEEPKPHILG